MTHRYERVVIVGASIAGLLAARVAADHAASVVLVERDQLSDEPRVRPGTPQARHAHGLLASGLNLFERFFPGFQADLDAHAVTRAEWMWDTIQHLPGGWTPRFHSGIISRPLSRPLLELLTRRRVAALPNVSIVTGRKVIGLVTDGDGRVRGVQTAARRHDGVFPETIDADLVIDASGRHSDAPDWLEAIGRSRPPESQVDPGMRYATRELHFRHDLPFRALLALPYQASPRGGVLTIIEDGRWLLTVAGYGKAAPPHDEDGFAGFLTALDLPPLHAALNDSEPAGPIYGYGHMINRMRHFERIDMPRGFIVMGDGACALNPVYGQGMSVCARVAELLAAHLARSDMRAFENRFQRALTRSVADAWLMATTEDIRFTAEAATLPLLTRIQHRYLDVLLHAAPQSPTISQALLETMHLLRGPNSLLRPEILAALMTRRGQAEPPPATLPARG